MADKDEGEESSNKNEHDVLSSPKTSRRAKKLMILSDILLKQETRNTVKKISTILNRPEEERTDDEKNCLEVNADVTQRLLKGRERKLLSKQRELETEDAEEVLQQKCDQLAEIIRHSNSIAVYTGAGISTAASIPDYRGPQGVWTLLQRGESLEPQDLSDAEPTVTHMCISELHKKGHVKHVVSQNCDGLHLRSGMPRKALSEVHGNMYIEICYNCKPHREYIRLFDVTEKTGVRKHHTGRMCKKCGGELRDTIVHFGEKGGQKSPYRWKEATKAANNSDVILCLGSSLKILKSYGCLWCMDRSRNKRPKLVIVNLQWTPKDEAAALKINGRCDDVLQRVMRLLGYPIPSYCREKDPIFCLCTPLTDSELESTTKKILEHPGTLRSRSASISSTETDNSSTSSDSTSSKSSVTAPRLSEDTSSTTSRNRENSMQNNFSDNTQHIRGETASEHTAANKRHTSVPNFLPLPLPNYKQESRIPAPIPSTSHSSTYQLPGADSSLRNTDVLNDMPLLAQAQFLQLQMKFAHHPVQSLPIDLSPTTETVVDARPMMNTSPVLSFEELVEKLTTCPSCTFLKEYGVRKQRCNICDKLKAAHSVFHKQYMSKSAGKTQDCSPTSVTGGVRISSQQETSSLITGLNPSPISRSFSSPGRSDMDSMVTDHFYLKPAEMKNLSPKQNQNKQNSMCNIRPGDFLDAKRHLDFAQKTSPTSSLTADPLPHTKSVDLSDTQSWNCTSAYQHQQALNMSLNNRQTTAYKPETEPNSINLQPGESSQDTGISEANPLPYVRSLSEECSGSMSDSDEKSVLPKKRKLVRCVSVPGWFGKGLNTKKKRKL